ncbi:MAG: 2-keto-4-pentenoate hydratase [Rhodospirillales bacterium]|jgi:2-keto-4-pentenoate hydratase/2-oxohepta-3-ene-1,7-dioic acid hydratase in catechol pathway|nr:2-keto-4-pentenoate hydratase [Rhodospirillales bacterium]
MASYKLITYQTESGPRTGFIVDDRVFDLVEATGKSGYATMLDVLRDWDAAEPAIEAAAAKAGTGGKPVASVKLLAPILAPPTIYCAGANYTDHVIEMAVRQNQEPDPDPHTLGLKAWHFIKASGTVTGPNAPVTMPETSKAIDWEVELTAVIGRTAKNLPLERALECVAGYTVGNDLSARDLGQRPPIAPTSPFRYDWLGQKCFDGACPLGPWIIPAKQIKDPQNLKLTLSVNEVIKQDSNTKSMIFNLAEQIMQISARLTLRPGDLIMTGTPAGVGAGRGEFLKRGDVVTAWVEDIGSLTNTMV